MAVPSFMIPALKHWKLLLGVAAIAATGLYVADLRADLSEVRAERNALQDDQNQTVGAVASGLAQIGYERAVTAETVRDEIGWLVGEYLKVNTALDRQNAALAVARAEAAAVQAELDRARAEARRVRTDRERLADAIRKGSGGLTADEWSKL